MNTNMQQMFGQMTKFPIDVLQMAPYCVVAKRPAGESQWRRNILSPWARHLIVPWRILTLRDYVSPNGILFVAKMNTFARLACAVVLTHMPVRKPPIGDFRM